MKLRTLVISSFACVAIAAFAAATYRPAKVGAYYSSDGSGGDGTWLPMAGSGGVGAAVGRVAHSGLYYSSDGSGNDGTWLPCGPNCFNSGTTTAALTMNSGGAGAASGTTFDGSTARTLSYNTLGAAPLASPTFTGIPAAPTAAAATSTTQLATTAFVQAAIAPFVFKLAPTTSPATNPVTVYTTPAGAGQVYRACAHLIVTVAGTGGSVFPALTFTASGHTYSGISYSQSGTGLSGGNVSANAQWNQGAGCFTFQADAATNIQGWVGLGGVTGTPSYSYTMTLERLQ